jgi:hypothetical protein
MNVQIGMKFPQIPHAFVGFSVSGACQQRKTFDLACKSDPKLAQIEYFCQIIPL